MGNELQVMGLNIAICDDEKVIREQIKELAEKEMPDVCAGLYETGDALLAAGKQFDIVFLDIQMEGTDGIETAKRLRQRDEDTILDLCQYFRQKKSKGYAAFLSSSSSFCWGVI